MTQDITFWEALNRLDGMEEEFLRKVREVQEQRDALFKVLDTLGYVPQGEAAGIPAGAGPEQDARQAQSVYERAVQNGAVAGHNNHGPAATGPSPDGGSKEEPNREEPNREEPNREEPNREEPNREEPNREEPSPGASSREDRTEESIRQEAFLQGIQAVREDGAGDDGQEQSQVEEARSRDAEEAERQEWSIEDVMQEEPSRLEFIADPHHLRDARPDFHGAFNFSQYMQRIGMAAGTMLLNPRMVAEYLRQTGLSQAELPGLAQKVKSHMAGHPRLYEISCDHTEPAFRYIGPTLKEAQETVERETREAARKPAHARPPRSVRRTPICGARQAPGSG